MTDWDKIVKKFFEMGSAHSFRCKFHYGAHWQDEVHDGKWYLHGHLIARYTPPRLYLSDARHPTMTTRSRLVLILDYWWRMHGLKAKGYNWHLSTFSTGYTIIEILSPDRSRFYMVHGAILDPSPEGLRVLDEAGNPAREVVPTCYSKIIPLKLTIHGFTTIGVLDGKLFVKNGKLYDETPLETLKEKLAEALREGKLGKKGKRLAALLQLAETAEDAKALIELIK